MSSGTRGLIALILAFLIWGLFPIYWKLLHEINSLELLLIRLILTAGACLLLMPVRGSWPNFKAAWGQPKVLGRTLFVALLLSGNWLSFLWAVNNGRVLESSLGYFLCPLASIVLARVVQKEHLGKQSWVAVAIATLGVLILVNEAGQIPVAAFVIAITWGSYGLMKKRSPLGPVVGLGLETTLLSFPAGLSLLILGTSGPVSLLNASPPTYGYLAIAGFLTAAPLLLFAYAAHRVRLSTIGMGQYIVPMIHFGLAIAYGEPVLPGVFGGFVLIWIGLVIYATSPDIRRKVA
jgi:chloramphenicol-sensitive protein RarD